MFLTGRVLRRLSETGCFPGIPVVIFSVDVDASTAASHGSGYLPKPIGAAQVWTALVGETLRVALGDEHPG